MKNFEKFVIQIVKNWSKQRIEIFEKGGLIGLPNRKYGDKAEDFILNKVLSLTPKYIAFKSRGSQSPADIYAVGRRKNYWHIMLIQVKSSHEESNIYKLSPSDIKELDLLAKFVKKELLNTNYLEEYWLQPIIISTGYAGALGIETRTTTRYKLIEAKPFKRFRLNADNLNIETVKTEVSNAHKLGGN